MSSISIIGTGNMARTIGGLAVAGGNTVEVMGRNESKAADLAKALGGGATTGKWGAAPAGDIVIVALLYDAVVPVVTQYGDALAAKVIVDISNPFNSAADGLAYSDDTSIAQAAAKAAPASASVVKAFNTIFRPVLEKGRPDVFIAGDEAQAKAGVETFIESLGLRPLDVGDLKMAHWLEGAGLVTMGLARNGVGNWDFALGVTEFPDRSADLVESQQRERNMMTASDNAALLAQWAELWSGNISLADEYVTDEFITHVAQLPWAPSVGEEKSGREALKQWISGGVRDLIPDMEFSIDAGPIADDNYMVVRWKVTGTYNGGVPGSSPAAVGRKIEFTGTDIVRIVDGKFVEYWLNADSLFFMQQIGMTEVPALQ